MDLIPLGIPAALLAYITVGRHVAFMVYVAAGATVFIREGREWTVKEAADRGRPLVWQTALSFVCLRLSEVDWAGLWAGFVLFCTQARLHAEVWWHGRLRDYAKVRAWLIACFRDREAERVAIAKAQYDAATLQRSALLEASEYDFEPTPWDGDPATKDHLAYRDAWDDLARKPNRTSADNLLLGQLLGDLARYGDNPLALRRVEAAPVAPNALIGLGAVATGGALVKTGLAWIAPRVTVLLVIVCALSVWQWRRADARADNLEIARREVEAKFAVAAKAIDQRDTLVTQTRTQCLAEISSAAKAAKDRAAADTAAKLRRQRLAQDKAASGSAPPVINPGEWMRSISGAEGGGDSAAPADPNPREVPGAGAGPAAPNDPGAVSSQPVPGPG